MLGSTGSIGTQALEVVKKFSQKFKIRGLSAKSNWKLLAEQAKFFKPQAVAIEDGLRSDALRSALDGLGIKIFTGKKAVLDLIDEVEADLVLIALVGISGLEPTLKAIRKKARIALANKESLVVAGKLVTSLADKAGVEIIPVDSEHSAIFQCLKKQDIKYIENIILTSSGGPFKNYSRWKMYRVRVKDALRHPTWKMGKKITVDSATLMNKGFEVIEAKWLFGVDLEKIKVIIHPQSIIHSFVEFKDGSVLAQMASPDMRLPISYALSYPERLGLEFSKLNLLKSEPLSFKKPDLKLFPCLRLAYDAAGRGGSAPVVLNAANEAAVELFLKSKIKFLDIPKIIERAIEEHKFIKDPDLGLILELDKEIKRRIYGEHN